MFVVNGAFWNVSTLIDKISPPVIRRAYGYWDSGWLLWITLGCARIAEGLAGHRDELPVIAGGMQG